MPVALTIKEMGGLSKTGKSRACRVATVSMTPDGPKDTMTEVWLPVSMTQFTHGQALVRTWWYEKALAPAQEPGLWWFVCEKHRTAAGDTK